MSERVLLNMIKIEHEERIRKAEMYHRHALAAMAARKPSLLRSLLHSLLHI